MEELKREARRAACGICSTPTAATARACATSSTRRSPRSPAAAIAPGGRATARRRTPATWRCSAQFGTEEQKERWLRPLLDGEIRSAFAMTEPEVASSDATNIAPAHRARRRRVRAQRAQVVDRRGAITPTLPDLHRHGPDRPGRAAPPAAVHDPRPARHAGRHGRPQSPGVRLRRPGGPRRAALRGRTGAGLQPHRRTRATAFIISQARLGPGRIHHCMRTIGVAERALELMCRRASERVTFGAPIASRLEHPGLDRRVAHRPRDAPSAHAQDGVAHGHGRQPGGSHRDRRDQGRGAEPRAAR